jgi:ATP-binding cassette subfamily F protein uup
VNTCLYFDGTGQINQIVGGYDDVDNYLVLKKLQRKNMTEGLNKKPLVNQVNQVKQTNEKQADSSAVHALKKKKLSFKEARELESLPEKIDALEVTISELQIQVNDANFFNQDEKVTQIVLNQLAQEESNLEIVYARWQELDEQ